MGMLKPIRKGSWYSSSEKDPRWDRSGEGLVGGLVIPTEVKETIEEITKLYGDPPKDLVWGYMKY